MHFDGKIYGRLFRKFKTNKRKNQISSSIVISIVWYSFCFGLCVCLLALSKWFNVWNVNYPIAQQIFVRVKSHHYHHHYHRSKCCKSLLQGFFSLHSFHSSFFFCIIIIFLVLFVGFCSFIWVCVVCVFIFCLFVCLFFI